jgi:hypothetical protein
MKLKDINNIEFIKSINIANVNSGFVIRFYTIIDNYDVFRNKSMIPITEKHKMGIDLIEK